MSGAAVATRSWQRVALAMFAVGWGANQFTPVLIAYRDEIGMGSQTRAFLFGVYAAGLVPMLLIGGALSDRLGRRAVVLPAVVLSPVATAVLIVFHDDVPGLAAGRLLAGVCSGVVFGAASAWVSDLTARAGADPGAAARRAAVALSAGFGVGPLVTGLVGQVVDHPLTVPLVPHLVIGAVALTLLWPVPGPAPGSGERGDPERTRRGRPRLPAEVRGRRFLLVVAPVAPWVFASVAIGFAFLPGQLPTGRGEIAFEGVLTGLALAFGVLVQPLAQRLEARRPVLAAQVGLVAVTLGLLVGVLALTEAQRLLLFAAAPALGIGYGCCLVSGLRTTERLADPERKGVTVSVFYALTYVGFAAPYVLGAISGAGLGPRGAVLLAVVATLVSLGMCSLAVSGDTRRQAVGRG